MRIFSRLGHPGRGLLLLAVIGLLVAACDDGGPSNVTPVTNSNNPTVLPTAEQRAVALGPALQNGGEALTFKTALAKALPVAKQWNPDALIELGSLVSPTAPGAGSWTITFVTPDGQQRELISVSGVDTQTQRLTGTVTAPIMLQVKDHNPLFDQVLDSPAIIEKVKALNYQMDADTQIKVVYYASAENVGVSSYPNPVVQVRLLKGESAIQLTIDALTGDVVAKMEQ
jgi:hypothetical protein